MAVRVRAFPRGLFITLGAAKPESDWYITSSSYWRKPCGGSAVATEVCRFETDLVSGVYFF